MPLKHVLARCTSLEPGAVPIAVVLSLGIARVQQGLDGEEVASQLEPLQLTSKLGSSEHLSNRLLFLASGFAPLRWRCLH